MNDESKERVDAIINRALAEKGIPGATLTIIENNQIGYARAYGVRNRETGEPLRVESLFHHASVTKLFVATALLQLVERGQLDLNAPVVRYVPYFQLNDARVGKITIKQMMNHTSGMPDTDDFGWDSPEYDDEALERYVRNLGDLCLKWDPGEKYFYSNIAYEVLGDVIAKVSGMTFEEFVAANILRPLGMEKSTLLVKEADPALLATPHTTYGTDTPIVSPVFPYNRAHAPSSTLYSNVLELSHFVMMWLNRGSLDGVRLLSAETVEAAWVPKTFKGGDFWPRIGLTWNIGTRQGHTFVGHSGEDVGFSSMVYAVPATKLGFVYLTNSDGDLLEAAGDEIFDLLLVQQSKTAA